MRDEKYLFSGQFYPVAKAYKFEIMNSVYGVEVLFYKKNAELFIDKSIGSFTLGQYKRSIKRNSEGKWNKRIVMEIINFEIAMGFLEFA